MTLTKVLEAECIQRVTSTIPTELSVSRLVSTNLVPNTILGL